MPELREHAGRHYAVQHHYALPDDAWCLELSEAVPMGAEPPNPVAYRAGRAFLAAYVPDEDPDLEPTVHIHSHDEHVIPYDVGVRAEVALTRKMQATAQVRTL
ncbi:hypothetical protein [Streptomyces bluensis]|uniref:Uncharacterized protein n=1 Tax=Streptomyces bluensis TaxID=33897 RepID=A0ABW6UIA6_9ACTN